jgi:hypothetical protein
MFLNGIFFDYITWHYSKALTLYIRLLNTWWWYIISLFAIPYVVPQLFTPYKGMLLSVEDTASLWQKYECYIINLVSRLFGAFCRILILLAGCFLLCVLVIAGTISYGLWLIAPFLPLAFISLGFLIIYATL